MQGRKLLSPCARLSSLLKQVVAYIFMRVHTYTHSYLCTLKFRCSRLNPILLNLQDKNFTFSLRTLNGARGDLSTLLPLMLGTIAAVQLPSAPALLGFVAFDLVTAAYYRLPAPVPPMNAVTALLGLDARCDDIDTRRRQYNPNCSPAQKWSLAYA
jgi:hypothetical protein